MEFNFSCPLKAKGSTCAPGFQHANAIISQATKSRHLIVRATICKSHGLGILALASMFKYDYLISDTSFSPTSFSMLAHSSIMHNY